MHSYDALIFDIDGTLWDSCDSCAEGWNLILEKLGNPTRVTASHMASICGKPLEECIRILIPSIGVQFEAFYNLLQTEETQVIEKKGANMYQGVLRGFQELSKKYPLYLLSNCQTRYMDTFLNYSELKPYLQDWDCHGMSGVSKGEMLVNMKQIHNLQNPVYIGDTSGDYEATQFAKVDFIYAAYGFGRVEKPERSFDSFREIVEFLR